MKVAGCSFINYGIESMDQTVLNNMKKGLRPEMIVQGIEDTLKVGISPGLNFIFGNIGDTRETIEKTVNFLLKYDDFAQKRTIRPVTPYPGSPLYYEAIKRGLLDKDNPAEDFYENKHTNSDLICCNFTEMSDDEYYECLRWANKTLMKNYFDKQKSSTLSQIDYLYDKKDVTFRGFRHNTGAGQVGETSASFKNKSNINGNDENKQQLENRGNQTMESVTNWENSSSDGERFSQQKVNENGNKNLKSFDEYLIKKQKRAKEKQEKAKKKKVIKNEEINTSAYTSWH